MKKRYLAVVAIAVGLFVTPAIASAVGTGDQADQAGANTDRNWMNQMHDSVTNGDGTGYEWMNQMHDSVTNSDGTGYEWMNQMHDSVTNGDGTGYEWMNQMHDSVTDGDTDFGGMMGFSG